MTATAEACIQALKEDDLQVRREAEQALVGLGAAAVLPLIAALENEQDSDVLWYIARALARIGAGSIQPLLEVLKESGNPRVKSYAAAALGGIGEPAIDPLIRVLLGSERAVRGEAARALCAIGARTIPHLKNALEQASPEEQRILEMMLMRVDESGIRAVLELQGIDPERRRDACSRIDERAE